MPKTVRASNLLINVRKSPPRPTKVFDTYWKFAHLRQQIYLKRIRGEKQPWTTDRVLLDHKFTNAFRASDRVSQYLIRSVIYDGTPRSAADRVVRILLFKIFNKIETWEAIETGLNEVCASTFNVRKISSLLDRLKRTQSIYSAAYIMPSGGANSEFEKKHHMHLHLLRSMLSDRLPEKILEAKDMESVFRLLRSYPTMGPFLAFQYATDLNYSELTNFSEMDFVVPGPGALNGIRKCFSSLGDFSEADVIRYVTDRQQIEFERLELPFENLWGRPLQLIDCQNLFCETDKYARVVHPEFDGGSDRTRIKQRFKMTGELPRPFFPPKWKINRVIQNHRSSTTSTTPVEI